MEKEPSVSQKRHDELVRANIDFENRYWHFMHSSDPNLTMTLFKADLLLVDPANSDEQCFLLPNEPYDVSYFALTNLFRLRIGRDLSGRALFGRGEEVPPPETQNLEKFVRDFPREQARLTTIIFPVVSGVEGTKAIVMAKRYFNPFSGNPYTGQAMAEIWTAERKLLPAIQ